jgi:hypothetical protein
MFLLFSFSTLLLAARYTYDFYTPKKPGLPENALTATLLSHVLSYLNLCTSYGNW